MMLLCTTFLVLWLTSNSHSASLYRSRHSTSRNVLTRRSSFFPNLDKNFAFAAQSATQRKFRNAPALLAGRGTSPGYAIPSFLQNAYNRASDYATDIALLRSSPKLSTIFPSISFSPIRVPGAGTLANVIDPISISLLDDTDYVDDFEYYGPLRFGSEAQTLGIDFDTGSADLWVTVNCDCGDVTSFQPGNSTTYQNTGQDFQVTYGSGFVAGTLAKDTVAVGPINVYNQSIGVVSVISDNFAQSPNDGLAGLAFSTIANSQGPTLFENLVSQSRLPAPLFSFYMTRTQPRGSEVCFGGIDRSKVKGSNISWVDVVSQTYWTVHMTGVVVKSLIPTDISAIIDTGTSFIYIPDEIVADIYKQIPGSAPAPDYGYGYYKYPCDAPVAVSFVLGTTTLGLDPRDMNAGRYASDSTGSSCVGAIIAGGAIFDTNPIAILGDAFLKSYVSVFDYSHGARVGFVESIDE